MKRRSISILIATIMLALVFSAQAMAEEVEPNIPVTANQAFDAVVKQADPLSRDEASVAIIDMRTAAEAFWVGSCAKVTSISVGEKTYVPVNGKVQLKSGRYLFFKVEHNRGCRSMALPINKVTALATENISLHIPLKTWNEDAVGMDAKLDFNEQIESLAGTYDVLILMCRSGKRSNYTGFDRSLFAAIYEIDQPNGSDGKGGFQGTSYSDAYNGYRGFPGRSTSWQSSPSASWNDAGLPIHIGWKPATVAVPDGE